jgi:hypothetical protein
LWGVEAVKRISLFLVTLCIILCTWISPTFAASYTWEKIGPVNNDTKVYLSPNYLADKTIYALAAEELYTSVDAGLSWRLVSGAMKTDA